MNIIITINVFMLNIKFTARRSSITPNHEEFAVPASRSHSSMSTRSSARRKGSNTKVRSTASPSALRDILNNITVADMNSPVSLNTSNITGDHNMDVEYCEVSGIPLDEMMQHVPRTPSIMNKVLPKSILSDRKIVSGISSKY